MLSVIARKLPKNDVKWRRDKAAFRLRDDGRSHDCPLCLGVVSLGSGQSAWKKKSRLVRGGIKKSKRKRRTAFLVNVL